MSENPERCRLIPPYILMLPLVILAVLVAVFGIMRITDHHQFAPPLPIRLVSCDINVATEIPEGQIVFTAKITSDQARQLLETCSKNKEDRL